MKRTRGRLGILLLASFAGILGAHAIDYWIIIPDAAHRHELLLNTGHGYWPYVGAIAVIAGIVAALASFGFGCARGEAGRSVRQDVCILSLLQTGGFVALEAVERLAAGSAGRAIVPLLVAGVLLQVAIAIGTALALRALARAGAAVFAWRRRAVFAPHLERLRIATSIARVHAVALSDRSLRGPPLIS